MGRGYLLSEIAAAVGGALSNPRGDDRITSLVIDSRKMSEAHDALFIALKGPRHDGHAHVGELVRHGLRQALVAKDAGVSDPDLSIITVDDTLTALHRLAAWHRSHFNYPVIGITGSNGKTVVKEWLYQLLRHEERIVRSPGSWNSQVGVPLSVWEMGEEHTLGIFEAGISQRGEMERLRPMIMPTIGVLTNIGPAHGSGFVSDAEKCAEKCRLFRDAEVLICGTDNAVVRGTVQQTLPSVTLRDWSRGHPAFVRVKQEVEQGAATSIVVEHDGVEKRFLLPFTDGASVENGITCITVLLHLGHDEAWISEGLAHLTPVDMRLRAVQGAHASTLIDDSYSNDLTSLRIALDRQAHLAHGRRRVVVLSDIAESGIPDGALYGDVARLLASAGVDQVIGVGPAITGQRSSFPAASRFHADVDALLHDEDAKSFAGAVVLVKGARAFRLERAVERWQHQVHGTELEVDLGAVRQNLNHYRALVKPDVRIMAMVKAFGYGSGALELARLFAHDRVHYLGVAYADEGIELRQHGIATPILVMNPEPVPMETLQRFDLEPEVYDARSLSDALGHAASAGNTPPVHIKLDTGMHRLGFTAADLPELLEALRGIRAPRVASILSHLAASEDPQQDTFTRRQIADFQTMAERIGEVLGYRPLWHVANSSGAARFPEAHFDMVRLGIGLHGIGVDEAETARLHPTVTLRTVIAQVKTVPPGESVSYGRRFIAERETRVATLPIGYADGLSRRLGNGVGKVWIDGKAAPFLGSICMDMCMVDVSGIECAVGHEVILFGPEHPLQEYARDLGTIPYEALTSISQRVRRVYVQG
jgi:alanine racemase